MSVASLNIQKKQLFTIHTLLSAMRKHFFLIAGNSETNASELLGNHEEIYLRYLPGDVQSHIGMFSISTELIFVTSTRTAGVNLMRRQLIVCHEVAELNHS